MRPACAAVGLCLVVAGCGAGATDPADAGSSDSASASPRSPEQQPTEAETTETTPEVEPATGPAIGVKGLEVRAPADWITATVQVG